MNASKVLQLEIEAKWEWEPLKFIYQSENITNDKSRKRIIIILGDVMITLKTTVKEVLRR